MKLRAYYFLLLACALYFLGCTPSKFIADQDKEKVFQHEVSLSKPQVKERLVTYANEKFVSSKAVLQSNEDGLLSGNGISQVTSYLGNPIKMEFTFIVKYTDKSYKVKWIVKNLIMNGTSMREDFWGYYMDAEDIDTFFRKLDGDMFASLSSDNLNF